MKSADELNKLGADLFCQGDNAGARLYYQAALLGDPNHINATSNMVMALADHDETLEAAAAWGRRLVFMLPNVGVHRHRLGNILMRLHRYAEAEDQLRLARALAPEDPDTWHASAINAYVMGGRELEAIKYVQEGLKLLPSSNSMVNDHGVFNLCAGNVEVGLRDFEARWYALYHMEPWDIGVPEWRGEDLTDKHLLLHSEMGVGDAIMLSRFVPELCNRAKKVTLAVPTSMMRLFAFQDWPVEVRATSNVYETDGFDFHSPMLSAWRWLGIDYKDISSKPYLKAPKLGSKIISRQLTYANGNRQRELSVGIVWASGNWGGTANAALRRIVPLKLFLPLTCIPGVKLFSLQVGDDAPDIEANYAEGLIEDVGGRLTDWAHTANVLEQFDLIIAAETGLVHLAGALGIPCWVLNPYRPCWRWQDSGRGNTGKPWYLCLTLFKQTEPTNWVEPMQRVKSALETLSLEQKIAA